LILSASPRTELPTIHCNIGHEILDQVLFSST